MSNKKLNKVAIIMGSKSDFNIMKEAISLGNSDTVGHEFFEDFEARFQKISRVTCPTGIAHLDKKEIHDPSEKIRDQLNYPKKILDLKESRLRAIDAFSAAKN